MTSTRVFHQASGAFVLIVGAMAGCNSIVGLDKIEVVEAPAESAGGASSSGSGQRHLHH